MRHFRSAIGLVLAMFSFVPWLGAQGAAPKDPAATPAPAFLPVPPNVKAEGLPPIPASIVQDLAPYAASRRAAIAGWHPRRREILITTAFDGHTFQIHSVAGPGMDRQQLTFFADGVAAPPNTLAWYAPDASYFVVSKDSTRGAEAMQLFRFDLATKKSTLLTDGTSRNGVPVLRHSSAGKTRANRSTG
jgi:hypothetical protein